MGKILNGRLDPRTVGRAIRGGRRSASDRTWPRTFADRLTDPVPTLREVFRVARAGGFRTDQSGARDIPVRHDGLPRIGRHQHAATWVGHATFVLRIGGLTVLTDPIWSDRMPAVPSRLTPPGVEFSDVPRVDAVVISHNHYDHLDGPTIRRLPRDTPILAPAALGRWLRRRGFHRTIELDWWESVEISGVRFDFVPAHHWSRRTPFDTCRTLWGGWVLTAADGTRIYFAGDTGYGHFLGEIGARYPGIDLALLPVGAFEPRWFMRPMHMNPEDAVRACGDLGAANMATMHWGTFVLSAEPLMAPVERARDAWRDTGRPREQLWDLAIGESRLIE